MAYSREEHVQALGLTLHGVHIAVLAHFAGNKNILTFNPDYLSGQVAQDLPVVTMRQLLQPDYLNHPFIHSQQLPPLLSNLLPEGSLREWMSSELKVNSINEFPMFAWAGRNLPGAIIAEPLPPDEIPDWSLSPRDKVSPIAMPVNVPARKFSLAGVQMKFSSVRQGARFSISESSDGESWIIKTPSTTHKAVVENEYTSMKLAEAAGITIPEVKLVQLSDLDGLPDIPLPGESTAYAIRRFDRSDAGRIHTEDFAQIMGLYPVDKYGKVNHEQIAAALHQVGTQGLSDVQQLARRLLVNILLGNGDAHIKNWSVYYPDQLNPLLAPAYDIVSTIAYVEPDRLALNLNKHKDWDAMTFYSFEQWAKRINVSWPAIRIHLQDVMEKARTLWPAMLDELPMLENHKAKLRAHWSNLKQDFRITT
ncbi:phosphatidylinositol kinase [Pseudidiomarina salinarum]|uniref:Phosphatidylinositol kinase n=1 Tax=Pseudidiomarina salinarum TaxID=435908 RepID=A0A094ITX9_9GAMM|nr:HipA domain-containing protein [Pseudidiomarina salinarum]KFZ31135.1 phosphatidylinositol kinase [Pseudidiomarina salinarum]RUO71218.1 type II toxin-antitoxin system HipA family toxin [Pseudidiomarina salinarum]